MGVCLMLEICFPGLTLGEALTDNCYSMVTMVTMVTIVTIVTS